MSSQEVFNFTVERYKEIREIGIELNGKFLEGLDQSDMKIALRTLGLMKGNKAILPSEEDMDRCYNFVVHDYRNSNGDNLVKKYSNNAKDMSKAEKEIIGASLASKNSLFKIINIYPNSKTIELKNLLEPTANIEVMDIGFSSNPAAIDLLMFSRIISFDDFSMTSGAPLLFSPEYEDILLSKYKKKMKKIVVGDEQTKMAASFFQLFQRYGYKTMGYA